MLTKTVLCAAPGGAWKLVEVPFEWQQGDRLPEDASQEHFSTAQAAMSELANRGRQAQRFHVQAPELPPLKARAPKPREQS